MLGFGISSAERGEELPDFTCDFLQAPKAFPHFWEHTVGSGHAPLSLRADWQAQMLRCHNELGFQYVRFHAILSDEMGTLIDQSTAILQKHPTRTIRIPQVRDERCLNLSTAAGIALYEALRLSRGL